MKKTKVKTKNRKEKNVEFSERELEIIYDLARKAIRELDEHRFYRGIPREIFEEKLWELEQIQHKASQKRNKPPVPDFVKFY